MARGKFEGSRYDKDRGVREGSKADLKRDAAEKRRMPKARKGKR